MTHHAPPTLPANLRLSTAQALKRILAASLAYAIAWQLGFWHWALPVGVMFVAAWALPYRWWPLWVVVATLQGSVIDLLYQLSSESPAWPSPLHWFLGMAAPPLLAMPGAAWLRSRGDALGQPVNVASVTRMLLAALLVATLYVAKDLVYVLADGQVIDIDQRSGKIVGVAKLGAPDDMAVLVPFATSHFIGAFVGIMLLAPLAMWWYSRHSLPANRTILISAAKYLPPMAAVYLLLAGYFAQIQSGEILRLMLLAVVIISALNNGWRGATLAILVASVAVEVQYVLGSPHAHSLLLQSFIAIAGAMGLLFGAARDELAKRDREMSLLAERLRDTARRNQTQADDLRRWITSEVHDEVGQNLTALQMQLKLAENASNQPRLFAPMREIIGHMRNSVSSLLGSLRPAGLDEFGLRRTLDEGSIRQLMQAAGVDYRVNLRGESGFLEQLPDEVQVSIYRIVQEAATNTLRHAGADRFVVTLRTRRVGGALQVVLRCCDNGIGLDTAPRRQGGIGLVGIEDRVLSLGGEVRLRSNTHGTSLLAVLRHI